MVEKEHDSGEGSHLSGGSEDRAPAAMARYQTFFYVKLLIITNDFFIIFRAILVHADTKKVMYFA